MDRLETLKPGSAVTLCTTTLRTELREWISLQTEISLMQVYSRAHQFHVICYDLLLVCWDDFGVAVTPKSVTRQFTILKDHELPRFLALYTIDYTPIELELFTDIVSYYFNADQFCKDYKNLKSKT